AQPSTPSILVDNPLPQKSKCTQETDIHLCKEVDDTLIKNLLTIAENMLLSKSITDEASRQIQNVTKESNTQPSILVDNPLPQKSTCIQEMDLNLWKEVNDSLIDYIDMSNKNPNQQQRSAITKKLQLLKSKTNTHIASTPLEVTLARFLSYIDPSS